MIPAVRFATTSLLFANLWQISLAFLSPTDVSFLQLSESNARFYTRLGEPINGDPDWSKGLFKDLGPLEGDPTAFRVGILGDLHIDPRKMDDYHEGRKQFIPILQEAKEKHGNVCLVSLGDLGESKNCEHNDLNPNELFSGTSACHEVAADYLSSFGVPYEVIGGNHDLEGIDEFMTDEENLEAFMKIHNKPRPYFAREIAEKTILVGLCSTTFREAKYTSHEVIIDDEQLQWFENFLKDHPADQGWKIFIFSHAPPNGSGLRVLLENHVVNGCCWLNHSDDQKCRKYIELVRKHRSIKAWFSGHFHLGQDYQDSITFPSIPKEEGPYPNRGSCVFAQTSVMRSGSSRDGARQSRLLRGNRNGFEICTVDHKNGGKIRLDATITYKDDSHEIGVYAHGDESPADEESLKVYQPQEGDEGVTCASEDEDDICLVNDEEPVTLESRWWWRLRSGRVLGVLKGMLLEYDGSTLAPLGLVVPREELLGKVIAVVDSDHNAEANDNNMERDQAILIHGMDGQDITVVQPNEDGSFWRRIVRNKVARTKEMFREKAALKYAQKYLDFDEEEALDAVASTWGPYTSTTGNALRR